MIFPLNAIQKKTGEEWESNDDFFLKRIIFTMEDKKKRRSPWIIAITGVVLSIISAALLFYIERVYKASPLPSDSLGVNIPFQYNDLLYYPPRSAEIIFFQSLAVFIPAYIFLHFALISALNSKRQIIANIILVFIFFATTEHLMHKKALESPVYTRPHPITMWENIPRYKNDNYQFNSYGFRNEEIPVRKAPNEKRILILGDSTPFGHSLPQEETIAYLLMKKLNEASGSGTKWTVINACLQAATSYQGKYIYEKKGQKFKPDIIIIAYNNDPRNDILSEKSRTGPRFLLPLKILLYKSEIYLLFKKHLVKQYIVKNRGYLSNQDNMTIPRVSRQEFTENLESIIKRGKSQGAKTMTIALPHNPAMERQSDDKVEYRDLMKEIPEKQGGYYFNLYKEFRKIPHTEKYFVDIHHLNVEGSRVASELIYKFLQENKLTE